MTDKREKTIAISAFKNMRPPLTYPRNENGPNVNDEGCSNNAFSGDSLPAHEIFATLVSSGVDWTPEEIPSCNEWSPHDYRRFIEGAMPDSDKARFIDHSEGCDCCQQGLGIVSEEIVRQREAIENEKLFRQAMHIFDQCVVSQEAPVALVVRLCQGAMELLSFAGSVLQMPTLQPVRGEVRAALERRPLLLEKEFDKPPFSVQLSLCPDQGADLRLGLSVFDREQEEFMAGIQVEVEEENKVGERRWHAITDDEGTASLTLPIPGRYRLLLITEDSLFAPLEFALTIE